MACVRTTLQTWVSHILMGEGCLQKGSCISSLQLGMPQAILSHERTRNSQECCEERFRTPQLRLCPRKLTAQAGECPEGFVEHCACALRGRTLWPARISPCKVRRRSQSAGSAGRSLPNKRPSPVPRRGAVSCEAVTWLRACRGRLESGQNRPLRRQRLRRTKSLLRCRAACKPELLAFVVLYVFTIHKQC